MLWLLLVVEVAVLLKLMVTAVAVVVLVDTVRLPLKK
jgi:hypothetical protein